MRILVIEDETKVAKALGEGLSAEGYDVRIAMSGEEGFFVVNDEAFDLVLLDLMLPRRDGLEILTALRKRGVQTPVLVLTAKDTVEDRVLGLDCGADDYVVSRSRSPSCSRGSARCSAADGWTRCSSYGTRTSRWTS